MTTTTRLFGTRVGELPLYTKGVGIFFAILIIVALSIMLYANYSNYTYDKDKTLDQTNQITKRQQGGNSALCKMGNMLN